MGVVVVGSVALDSIETPKGSVERVLGGTAIHFSNAASLLSKPSLVGVVGEDFPQEGADFLSRKHVNIEGLEKVTNGKTFSWVGRYEKDMHTAITLKTDLNVFESFSPQVPQSYIHSDFLFLGNIDPQLQNQVYEKIQAKKATILDSMNFWIDSKRDDLLTIMKKVDIVLLNDQEVRDFTGCTNIIRAADEILQLGPRYVIVKQGAYGACIFSQEGQICSLPSYPLKDVCDPTGAGDSFAGAFVSYLDVSRNFEWSCLQRALSYAIVVASFCVEDFGVEGLDHICLEDVRKRYEQYASYSYCLKDVEVFKF